MSSLFSVTVGAWLYLESVGKQVLLLLLLFAEPVPWSVLHSVLDPLLLLQV